jgi:hypothetical protein
MPTLNEAVSAQTDALAEISNRAADHPKLTETLIATLGQQTAALQAILTEMQAAEQTTQVSPPPSPTPAEEPVPAPQEPGQEPAPVKDPAPTDANPAGSVLATTARDFRAAWTPDEYARVAADVGSEVASAFDNAAQLSEDDDVVAALSVLRGKNDLAERMQKVLGPKMAPASALFAAVQQQA